jgi:hypothetical protein
VKYGFVISDLIATKNHQKNICFPDGPVFFELCAFLKYPEKLMPYAELGGCGTIGS